MAADTTTSAATKAAQERARAGRKAVTELRMALVYLDAAKAKAKAAGWQREAGRLNTEGRELQAVLVSMRERQEPPTKESE